MRLLKYNASGTGKSADMTSFYVPEPFLKPHSIIASTRFEGISKATDQLFRNPWHCTLLI